MGYSMLLCDYNCTRCFKSNGKMAAQAVCLQQSGKLYSSGNIDGSLLKDSCCFVLNTCDASEHVNNMATQILMFIKKKQCSITCFCGGAKVCCLVKVAIGKLWSMIRWRSSNTTRVDQPICGAGAAVTKPIKLI